MNAPGSPAQKDVVFVVLQFVLFIVYIFRIPAIDIEVTDVLRTIGLYVSIFASVLTLLAFLAINTNLSPFPTPISNGKLIRSGVYKYVRHPIYSGILWASLGFALYSENTFRFIVFLSLLVLFILKARYEESLLQARYPDYADYQKTSGMFLPWI
ncbi:MAG: isoprenylcysteine carboxylmethyltransferase family protein [Saprospiraceae bacterium]|jgi:protein-S-isoprenylcysteine O-methyltransferase Ste14|nr:isoprenylcysteine carboxylmethyltransferase family protein [Saprospiraceae bacterium]